MLFEINHKTEFFYNRPVFLEPHTVRLRPRCDVWQNLLAHEIHVEPQPASLTESIDLDGNSVAIMWFDGTHESLSITASSTVETMRHNPFDFVLDSESLVMPVKYDADLAISLAPYCDRVTLEDEISTFSTTISTQVDRKTLPFLSTLTKRLHESFEHFVRPKGDPWSPSVTLAKGRGACRDMATLQIAAIRAAGLPARFVSGYRAEDPEAIDRELHAWVEVYLPRAGWRGYDPTTGLAVADGHIALAAGPNARVAAPTSGTFRGTGVDSSMSTSINMTFSER